jgi:hypothetical protein
LQVVVPVADILGFGIKESLTMARGNCRAQG